MVLPAIPIALAAAKFGAALGGKQLLKHVATAGLKAGVRGAPKIASTSKAFSTMAGKSIVAGGKKGFQAIQTASKVAKAVAGAAGTSAAIAAGEKVFNKIKKPLKVQHKKPSNKMNHKTHLAPGGAILHQSEAFKRPSNTITQMTGAKHAMHRRPIPKAPMLTS